MAILNTANSHHIHLLVAEQIPDFVRDDHPVFVEFIEKYYEFLAQANTGILTSDSESHYYGADYAMRSLVDVPDIDTTDLDNFISLFKSQYGRGLPKQLDIDRRLLYKNLIDFYRAKGTEDSFKFLFRALYNDDIELYYPKQDMLIASGGNYTIQATIQVPYSEGLKDIVGKKIVGETSGATATVESMNILPFDSELAFKSGRYANNDGKYVDWKRGSSLENVFDSEKLRELQSQKVLLNLNAKTVEGKFDYYETVYTDDLRASVNTVILPILSRRVFEDTFNYEMTSLISFDSGTADRTQSYKVPWGTSSISANSDHGWFSLTVDPTNLDAGSNGQITFISGGSAGSIVSGNVLQIGNTGYESGDGEPQRQLVSKQKILFDDTKLYKMVVRARDLGGIDHARRLSSNDADNLFFSGIIPINSDNLPFNSNWDVGSYGSGSWFYYVAHGIAIDDAWYDYEGWFKGRQTQEDFNLGNKAYDSSDDWGSGARIDLPLNRKSPDAGDAISGNVYLPYDTKYFSPYMGFNGYSVGGVSQCDYVYVEEWDSMLLQTGQYEDESSHLSSKSAYLHDNWYYQIYSYDIRTQNDLKNYKQILKDTVHPAGMKMFATKSAWEPMTTSLPAHTAQNNLLDATFSPDVYNSLAGWFKADSIAENDIDYRRWSPEVVGNGTFGSTHNWLPVGMSGFDEVGVDYTDLEPGSGTMKPITVDYSLHTPPPIKSSRSLKLTENHVSSSPHTFLIPNIPLSHPYQSDFAYPDHTFPIILEPNKTWLFSAYVLTNNVASDIASQNAPKPTLYFGTSTGTKPYVSIFDGYGPVAENYLPPIQNVNTWERLAVKIDATNYSGRKALIRLDFPNRTSALSSPDVQAHTGNTFYLMDGLMLEEYDAGIHGTTFGSYTPSHYVLPGMHGANVMSWQDSSPNKLHAHANTSMVFGTQWAPPQYISNTGTGHPAIRFRSNNVYQSGQAFGNVYQHSSFPTKTSNYMTGLQGKTSPAANTLPRPIANQFTGFVVARTNLSQHPYNYGLAGSVWPQSSMSLFNVGQRNSLAYGSSTNLTSNGAYDLRLVPSYGHGGYYQTYVANSLGFVTSIHQPPGEANPLYSNSAFRIHAMSENATTNTLAVAAGKTDDLFTFNFNGRRWGSHNLNQKNFDGTPPANTDLSSDRLDYAHQLRHGSTFSIGHALEQDYDSAFRAHSWFDGDMAEIVWFNEQLSNTSIAMVEGYLAHKYGIQDDLIHKDGPNAANTISHQWNFTNSQDGWVPYLGGSGSIAENPTDLRYDGGTGGSHYMDTDISYNPIDGTGFNKMKIRMKSDAGGGSWTGNLHWTVAGEPNQDLDAGYMVVAIPTEPGTSYTDTYVDLSGESNWTGKMINKLRLKFSNDTNTDGYNIDEITVHDDTRKYHPFKYEAPLEVGFSNTWFKGY